jgi:CRISPR-associated protein Cas1
VEGAVSGNVLLRREQYRRADSPEASCDVTRTIVLAKIANSRAVLRRGLRDHAAREGMDNVEGAVRRLSRMLTAVKEAVDQELLRGLEGDAGRTYFEVFDCLITSQRKEFSFKGRSRRPPLDNMNALLSFLYTLLVHDCTGALEAVGLDPQVGFLHRDRPGRPSLALDMMEEFRAFFADRLALSLVNLRQVQGKGFRKTESGAVEMTDETRKTVLVAYQKRKQEPMIHPFLHESAPLGLFFHLQAQLLARHLRGDLDGYPPVLWK